MEILVEKKNKNIGYEPILEGIPDWPVYLLSKNRKEFLEEVTQKAIEQIRQVRPSRKQLIDELEATVFREQNRLKRNRWRVDSKDEPRFWSRIKNDLVELTGKTPEEGGKKEAELLLEIVQRYAKASPRTFRPTSNRIARVLIKLC